MNTDNYIYQQPFTRAVCQLVRYIRDKSPRLWSIYTETRVSSWVFLQRDRLIKLLRRIVAVASCRVLSRAYKKGLLTNNTVLMTVVVNTILQTSKADAECLKPFLTDYGKFLFLDRTSFNLNISYLIFNGFIEGYCRDELLNSDNSSDDDEDDIDISAKRVSSVYSIKM